MEIEGERVSSSQNERTLRGEGVLENEQGPTGDWVWVGVKTREFLTKHTFLMSSFTDFLRRILSFILKIALCAICGDLCKSLLL